MSVYFFFSAIYLALTLIYGTLSVIFVICVLMVNHRPEEDPIPSWVKTFTFKFLMPITCWNGCCCGKRKDTIEPLEAFTKTEKQEKVKVPDEDNLDMEDDSLSWKTLSLVLDKFFFLTMTALVGFSTFIIFTVMIVFYASK